MEVLDKKNFLYQLLLILWIGVLLELVNVFLCFGMRKTRIPKVHFSMMQKQTNRYIRHDCITDWILKEVRNRFSGSRAITKEHVFYYVYGLLHSKQYRERFADDLKKSLPRIPIVDNVQDFMAFYKAGKELADLHLNYVHIPKHTRSLSGSLLGYKTIP